MTVDDGSSWTDPEVDHVVSRLALDVGTDGDLVVGRARVHPELCVDVGGADALRASVVLTWADVLAGGVAGLGMSPRVPLTLDLEVQVLAVVPPGTTVHGRASMVRAGRSVTVTDCRFADDDGRPLAHALATFVPAPDPTAVFPDGFPLPDRAGRRLSSPLADRLGCRAVSPGRAEMPRRDDALNAVGALQGGLATVAIEDAVLSLDGSVPLTSLAVRYLRPVMVGPAVAVVEEHGAGLHTAVLTDSGTGKSAMVATARTGPLP